MPDATTRHAAPLRRETPERPHVIGHRGFPRRYPENTWEGFHGALAAGADGIELDVRLAADGVPVVCHDRDLRRTHGERVPLAAQRAADLPVPTLLEVMTRMARHYPDRLVDIELKDSVTPAALQGVLDDAGWAGPAVVTSFDLATVREHGASDRPVGLLVDDRRLQADDGATLMGTPGVSFLGVKNPVFMRSLAEVVHASGGALWVWTLNRRTHIRRAARLGADAIITDRTDKALDVLGTRAL